MKRRVCRMERVQKLVLSPYGKDLFENAMNLPPPLRWLYKGWMAFSHALGMVMSKIILTILWIVGFGTYGIVIQTIGLFAKKQSNPATYWVDTPEDFKDSMKYQF